MKPGCVLRIGIIGAGRFAHEHIARLAPNPAATIVAICDPSAESLALVRERHPEALEKAAVYRDYRDLLDRERPDAVVICSPHQAHYAQTIDSLKSGAHVLLEKPLANTIEQAEEIVRCVKETGKLLGVAFQRRTWPPVRFVRALIEKGTYGPVQAVTAVQQEGWQAAIAGTWRQDVNLSGGGYLHDGGSHLLDLILWTTCLTPSRVAAFEDRRTMAADVNTVLSIQFAEGGMANIAVIGGCGGSWRQEMTICCDRATIFLDMAGHLSVEEPGGRLITPLPDDLPAGTDVDTNFVNAVLGREPLVAEPEWGLKIMRLIAAINRSAQTGGSAVTLEPVP